MSQTMQDKDLLSPDPCMLKLAKITALGNDTLTCTVDGKSVTVHKPPKLIHDAAHYTEASALTTVDTNEVLVTYAAHAVPVEYGDKYKEHWHVAPAYEVGDTILIALIGGAWYDMNTDARAWQPGTLSRSNHESDDARQ